jgi:Tfp pilus assembly protein FimT
MHRGGHTLRRNGGGRAAFSLLEVILMLALVGLTAALFISGAAALARPRDVPPREQFWSALTAARQLALESGREVRLTFDRAERRLAWSNGPTQKGQSIAVSTFEFLPDVTEGAVLLGGELTETTTMTSVRVYPDGTCDPFRAQVRTMDGRRAIWQVDPWTCAPILSSRP